MIYVLGRYMDELTVENSDQGNALVSLTVGHFDGQAFTLYQVYQGYLRTGQTFNTPSMH